MCISGVYQAFYGTGVARYSRHLQVVEHGVVILLFHGAEFVFAAFILFSEFQPPLYHVSSHLVLLCHEFDDTHRDRLLLFLLLMIGAGGIVIGVSYDACSVQIGGAELLLREDCRYFLRQVLPITFVAESEYEIIPVAGLVFFLSFHAAHATLEFHLYPRIDVGVVYAFISGHLLLHELAYGLFLSFRRGREDGQLRLPHLPERLFADVNVRIVGGEKQSADVAATGIHLYAAKCLVILLGIGKHLFVVSFQCFVTDFTAAQQFHAQAAGKFVLHVYAHFQTVSRWAGEAEQRIRTARDQLSAICHFLFRQPVQIHHLQVVVCIYHFGHPSLLVGGGERTAFQLFLHQCRFLFFSVAYQRPYLFDDSAVGIRAYFQEFISEFTFPRMLAEALKR